MKKTMFTLALLCGALSLCGEEIPAKVWTKSSMQGKFTFDQKAEYPIKLACSEASAGAKVAKVGVWGRYMYHAKVEAGKNYELKVTYSLTGNAKTRLYLWLRGGYITNISCPKKGEDLVASRKFTVNKDQLSIYLNLMDDIGELTVKSVELNKVD